MRSLLVASLCFIATQIAFAEEKKEEKSPVAPKFAVHFEGQTLTFDGYACAPDFILDLMLEETRRAKLLKSMAKIGLTVKGEPTFKEWKDGDKNLGFEFQFKINDKMNTKTIAELADKIPLIVSLYFSKEQQEKIKIAIEMAKLIAEKPVEVDGIITITGLTRHHKENSLRESIIKLNLQLNYKPAN